MVTGPLKVLVPDSVIVAAADGVTLMPVTLEPIVPLTFRLPEALELIRLIVPVLLIEALLRVNRLPLFVPLNARFPTPLTAPEMVMVLAALFALTNLSVVPLVVPDWKAIAPPQV